MMPAYQQDVSSFSKWNSMRKREEARPWPEQNAPFRWFNLSRREMEDQVERASELTRGLKYISDGLTDIWQAPWETFERKGGDCEDLAIVKLTYLEWCGAPVELVICTNTYTRELHAVARTWLSPHDMRDFLVLDSDDKPTLMVPEVFCRRYTPIYALSQHGWRHCHE